MSSEAKIPGPDHPISIEPNRARITVRVGGRLIAETTSALTMREAAYPPVHYVPFDHVDVSVLRRSQTRTFCPYKGDCSYYDVSVPGGNGDAGAEILDAVWTYEHPYPAVSLIESHVAFYPGRVEIVVADQVMDHEDHIFMTTAGEGTQCGRLGHRHQPSRSHITPLLSRDPATALPDRPQKVPVHATTPACEHATMIIPLRSTAAPSTPLSRLDRGRRLPPGAAFGGSALSFAALYLAAGAPAPLLVVYQRQWGFPAWVLTIAFAAYAVGLLAALLVVGSVSDYLGRRPVLIAALLVELASMLLFVFAPGIGWIIVARTVQGIATGAATSAFTASIVELAPQRHKRLGTIVSGVAPAGGLGLGALLTGATVQFTTNANLIVFTILAVVMAMGTLVVTFTSETNTPRPGAGRTLIPRVAIPTLARREFDAAIPVHISAWMLAALFIGLAPMIIRDIFGIDSGLLNGATVFVEPASAAAAGFLLGRITPRTTTVVGGASVVMGTAIIIGGVVAALLPLVWIGGIIGGVGFGASFSGALRTIIPLAEPQQRAGMFAAVYLVAYLAFGIPAIVAGLLVAHIGLLDTVLAYSGATFIVATVGLLTQSHMRSTADHPRATARPG